jgi:hypothetical protein
MKMNVLNKCIDLGFHKMKWNKEYKSLTDSVYQNKEYYVILNTEPNESFVLICKMLDENGKYIRMSKQKDNVHKISFKESLKIMDLFYRV